MCRGSRKHLSYFSLGLVVAGALLFAAGCQDNPLGRRSVSGQVRFAGKPLEKGTIDFRPIAGNRSVASGARITSGGYTIVTRQGLPPGKYEVRIFSSLDDTRPRPAGPPGGGSPPAIEQIPPRFNVKTEQVVEVTAAGPNRFDFDIPAK
jgi:hypothetical protein